MAENYGSDFITIVDDDGTELELEVLTTVEYDGCEYLGAIHAGMAHLENPEIIILKCVEEDGESYVCFIEDEWELAGVEALIYEEIFDWPVN